MHANNARETGRVRLKIWEGLVTSQREFVREGRAKGEGRHELGQAMTGEGLGEDRIASSSVAQAVSGGW